MFNELYIDLFKDGLVGFMMGIVIWLLSLFIVFFVGYGILYLIDYSFRPTQETFGKLVNKEFIPEHSETHFNPALKMPTTTHYDDEWVLTIEVDGLTDDISVSQDYYNKCPKKIKVKYSNGRIWNSLYIKEIY